MSVRSWEEYEKGLLLQGKWLPLTECIIFVNAPLAESVDALVSGPRGQHLAKTGYPWRSRPVEAESLGKFMNMLLPMESPQNIRYLLLPTAKQEWTAMFTSEWRGQDTSSMGWFKAVGLECVSVTDSPNSKDYKSDRGFYGSRKITMSDIHGEDRGYGLGALMTEPRRWSLLRSEREFPGGNIWNPDAKRIPDKFTHENLKEMAERLGLRAYDEDFYAPDGKGVMLERTDPGIVERTFTLAQARGDEPIDW